jgi:hypothetical protein
VVRVVHRASPSYNPIVISMGHEHLRAMARGCLFARLYTFLLDRLRSGGIRDALPRREIAFGLWRRVLDSTYPGTEYFTAILLTYALLRNCEGIDGVTSVQQLLATPDPEFAAKSYFEDTGALRFSEFDL